MLNYWNYGKGYKMDGKTYGHVGYVLQNSNITYIYVRLGYNIGRKSS